MPAKIHTPPKPCALPSCDVMMVRRPGENTRKFAERKFCSYSCGTKGSNRARQNYHPTCKSQDCDRPTHAQGLCRFGYGLVRAGKYLGSCAHEENPWRLTEDGIIDEVAVQIASHGLRRVALTQREARLALEDMATRAPAVIYAAQQRGADGRSPHGLFVQEAMHRLGLSQSWTRALVYSGTIKLEGISA